MDLAKKNVDAFRVDLFCDGRVIGGVNSKILEESNVGTK